MLRCALGWAGWGHPRLHLSINVAFGASDLVRPLVTVITDFVCCGILK